MKHPKAIIKKSEDGQYYFVVTARNGKVLVTSETYKTKANAHKGLNALGNATDDIFFHGDVEEQV